MPSTPRRFARIVATLGPASETLSTLRRMVDAGMDVARLNMSHGDALFHRRIARRVRQAARLAGRPVGLLVDLQGPKVRLGRFDGEIPLRTRMSVTLTTRSPEARPAEGIFPVDYAHLPVETEPGHELLLDDGAVRLRVLAVRGHQVVCDVLEGDSLRSRVGLAIPQARALRTPLTAKDKRDMALAVELGADFIALSFVRRAEDLLEARRWMARLGSDALLIAKIETRQAVDALDDVLAASDVAMVARGDLGIALPTERVPIEQKRIIEAAGAVGKPVITATQMLESMRHASRPTRAEASDVANAVLDGSWALMLSAETASGEYPVESVAMMDRVAREAERELVRRLPKRRRHRPSITVSEGIAEAGAWIAMDIGAQALVALTRSGSTARQTARAFPTLPVIAYSTDPRTLSRMTIYRGVEPRPVRATRSLDQAIRLIDKDLRHRRQAARGDLVVVLSGFPHEKAGSTNRITVHRLR